MFANNNFLWHFELSRQTAIANLAGSTRGVRGRGAMDRFRTSIFTWKDEEPLLSEEHDVEGMIWQLEEMEVRQSGMLLMY